LLVATRSYWLRGGHIEGGDLGQNAVAIGIPGARCQNTVPIEGSCFMSEMLQMLFVLDKAEVGGPQKSLLALLDNLDPERVQPSVCILVPGGRLESAFRKRARVLYADELASALLMPADRIMRSLPVLAAGGAAPLLAVLGSLFKHVALRANMNQERQRLWKRYSHRIPPLPARFDVAFGIGGMSSYYVVDCVDSRRRYHWVRSDARILNRDTTIDAEYYGRMDGALAVSNECALVFEDMYPSMRGRVIVVHNHIPVRFYNEQSFEMPLEYLHAGRPRILSVCRLDPLKGIELAIEACELLVKQGQSVSWFVLGDGGHRRQLERLVRKHGLGDHFAFLGYHQNTLDFIRECDVFVHPSLTEGKANAIDEAKFIGRPIVVTDYPTVKDQVTDGVNGLVCKTDSQSIAEAVRRLLSDECLAQSLAASARGTVDAPADITSVLSGISASES